MMKKILFLFTFTGFTITLFSQTLFTYGGNAVDKAEFLRAYNKNKIPVTNKEEALRDYLDLYIKFKLKVKAAKDIGLDTLPQLQYDSQSFRSQIENSYLNNEKALNDLLDEAFSRSQKDLHIAHYFYSVAATDSPDDTLKAYKSISGIYDAVSAGKNEKEKMAAADPAKFRTSDLGFITAFSLPYEYENQVYNLKPGATSKPYRSKNGWHFFKLIEERKAVGKWKIAQILFSIPPEATEADKAAFKKKADSVYQLIKNGEEFGKMARWFSDDKVTYGNGGEMAEFGSGKFIPAFESEVFKLTKDNEVSKPFITPYGYHIVKRVSQSPVATDKKDAAFQYDLRENMQKDARINIARDLFVQEVLKQVGFKKSNYVSDADLYRFADTVIAHPTAETSNSKMFPIANKAIYGFAKTVVVTGKDWLDFVRSFKGKGELYQGETNAALADKFITGTVMDYYKNHLEDYNKDFSYQMEEFRDGNMLFEIMEKNVWGKAPVDNEGLQKTYTENKSKYLWAASADILLFNCTDKAVADKARTELLAGKNWRAIMEAGGNNIQVDSGRFELAQIPAPVIAAGVDAKTKTGTVTEPVVNTAEGYANFVKIVRHYPANTERTFEEAKGMVINDYQNKLEENWITELKKKYPVKINEAVFQSLIK